MKIYFTISLLFVFIVLSSCKKEGCTDSYAVNYDDNAKKNDGSCIYFTRARITYVSCSGWPNTNVFGNPWDSSDDPDSFISISLLSSAGQSISYKGNVTNNNSSNFEDFTVDMAIIDSLNQSIHIAVEDEDGLFDSEMNGENINLWEFTKQGPNEHKYSSTIVRGNFSINIEWIE